MTATTWKDARGLAFIRMRPIKLSGDRQKPGQIIARMLVESVPPPWAAEAWQSAGGEWCKDFGGRWKLLQNGHIEWEWH